MENIHSGIVIIIGTKAELIKCMPIMLELQRQNKKYWFIHTGQHSLKDSCEKFEIKRPDFVLSQAPKTSTKFWSKINQNSILWFLFTIKKIKKTLKKIKPSYVIYHGDTMSTAAGAIASSKLLNLKKNWKNVHLEAGLRSGSFFEPFPEEISRHLSDFFSDILLAVSNLAEQNLKKYKNRKEIIQVGNTIVDSALISYNESKKMKFEKPKGRYTLINIHRHENISNKKRLKNIIRILKEIKIKAIWPIHDNTRSFLDKYGLMKRVERMNNIKIVPLTDYFYFIFLLANCKYLITDGGSIQEESLVFKKPCIILRKRTERQEGLLTGINFLTKLDVNYAKKIIEKIESNHYKAREFKNPYGKKGLSKEIIKILK